jgi:hypothetical protein
VAWFNDLSSCDYFGDEFAPFLRAVGWLERGKPFVTAARDRRIYEKLLNLRMNPWQPAVAAGNHACDLCQYEPEACSTSNLFIPGGSFLYVCPELIVHYMNAHGYGPPQGFCDAVLACPPMRSMEYHKAILASGGRSLVKYAEGSDGRYRS